MNYLTKESHFPKRRL